MIDGEFLIGGDKVDDDFMGFHIFMEHNCLNANVFHEPGIEPSTGSVYCGHCDDCAKKVHAYEFRHSLN